MRISYKLRVPLLIGHFDYSFLLEGDEGVIESFILEVKRKKIIIIDPVQNCLFYSFPYPSQIIVLCRVWFVRVLVQKLPALDLRLERPLVGLEGFNKLRKPSVVVIESKSLGMFVDEDRLNCLISGEGSHLSLLFIYHILFIKTINK